MSRPLIDVLSALDAPRLVVVGDVMLDRYLTGVVRRVSPEAPIQILHVERKMERLGGAGSVATNARVLGAQTTLVGVLGDDEAGHLVEKMVAQGGLDLEVERDATRPTSVKTRHVARSHTSAQQVLRVDEEAIHAIDDGIAGRLRTRLERLLPGTDAVVVSDYGKGVLTPALLSWLIDAGRARGVPVVVDPKGDLFERYRGATCVTPNRPETQQATGIVIGENDFEAAERAAGRLLADVGLDFALLTLDREGMYLKVKGQPGLHLPTTPREVFDVTGAGDMVLSTLAVALASGATPEEAAALANVAAGIEVEHFGVVSVSREEIAERVAGGAGYTKLVDPSRLPRLLDRLRAEGRRVVFTNGCFDILHAGHVQYLQQARRHGDVLLVGLNSDDSVRRLKGDGRPVNGAADRAAVLSALSCVDHVVVFAEDTPDALIRRVLPDVLVKGEDWREKGVVGREVVEARGGKVVLIPLLEGRSTTETIRRAGPASPAREPGR